MIKRKKYIYITNDLLEAIIKMTKEGRTAAYVAEHTGFAESTIWAYRKKYGLLKKHLRKNFIEKYTISQSQEKPLAKKPRLEPELSQIEKIFWSVSQIGNRRVLKSEITSARARLVMDSLGQYGALPDSDKIVQLTMSLSLRKEGKHYTLIDED